MNPQATTLAGTSLPLLLLLQNGLQDAPRVVLQADGLQLVVLRLVVLQVVGLRVDGFQALVVVAVPSSVSTLQVVAVLLVVLAVFPVGLVVVFQAGREVSRVVAAR
jgi:hypothetical protein